MLTSVKHAFRVLRKDPGFTAVAICSMAIGIGATSAMFSFADAMLMRPLPIVEPDRVVAISTTTSGAFANATISYPDYVDLRDRNRTFEGLVAGAWGQFGFSPNSQTLPRMKYGLFVSGNLFRVLGVEPALGRGFRPDEDKAEGRDAVVVLGHDFWMSQFGASRSVLGSHVRLNGIEFTVIGVAPEHFTGVDQFLRPALFVPLAMSPRMAQQSSLHKRDVRWLFIKGRLKPGVGMDQAQADIASISKGLQKTYPETDRDQQLRVETELQVRIDQAPPMAAFVGMLVLLGLCVLAVACANVAGLLLSRSRARSREIAVRLAIGAGRGSLVRQLLFENLLVAVAGGVAGVFVAYAGTEFFNTFSFPSDLPIAIKAAVDGRVLLFTLAVSVVSTLFFGLAPALGATRPDLVRALKAGDADSGGKQRFWGRNTIVAGQVALSLVLLTLSAVLLHGFRSQLLQGPGFRTERLFLTSFETQLAHYSDDQTSEFYKNLLQRTRSAPGVRSAALTSAIPLISGESADIVPEGYQLARGERTPRAMAAYVSEGYFETLNIPIQRGRGFLESDRQGAPLVAVVNEYGAKHFWPKGDALGKRMTANGDVVQIVGIARNGKYVWLTEPPFACVYLPFRQHPRSTLTLVAESSVQDAATSVCQNAASSNSCARPARRRTAPRTARCWRA